MLNFAYNILFWFLAETPNTRKFLYQNRITPQCQPLDLLKKSLLYLYFVPLDKCVVLSFYHFVDLKFDWVFDDSSH